jgi:hypothetical protein
MLERAKETTQRVNPGGGPWRAVAEEASARLVLISRNEAEKRYPIFEKRTVCHYRTAKTYQTPDMKPLRLAKSAEIRGNILRKLC